MNSCQSPSHPFRLLLLLSSFLFQFALPLHAACGGISQAAANNSGSIVSHSTFGLSLYSSGMNCQWTVAIPLTKTSVVVSVDDLSLGVGDCLSIRRYSDSTELFSLCNGTAAGDLMVLTGAASVRFASASSSDSNRSGFRLILRPSSSNSSCVGPARISASSGTLTSHFDLGSRYSHNLRCYWRISAPSGWIITSWFTYMKLEANADKVYLYSGSSASSGTEIAALTSVSEEKYKSSNRDMTVYFYTGGSVGEGGFAMKFESENEESEFPWLIAIVFPVIGVVVTLFVCVGRFVTRGNPNSIFSIFVVRGPRC